MKKPLVVLSSLVLSGCALVPENNLDRTWQALHIIDAAQTMSLNSDPCLEEINPMTRTLIGKEPSDEEVIAWYIGTAVGHYFIGQALDRWWNEKAGNTWRAITVGAVGYTVVNNHQLGMRPFGNNTSECNI